MKTLITGGAGFIGSNLAKELVRQGHFVTCVDNFELGKRENIEELIPDYNFSLKEFDLEDTEGFFGIVEAEKPDIIIHLAANSDIQKSAVYPGIDFKNTFLTTYSVLEAMRRNGVKRMFFASTSAVYGNMVDIDLKEDQGGLSPISYYGGAKLASEAFISSYAYMNEMDVTVFRFPNVIGPQLTHGVIFDFIAKLRKDPSRLEILGDGTQSKPYIYVDDLIEAILLIGMSDEKGVNTYNIGVEGTTPVTRIADMVCNAMGLENVEYCYTGGNVGWKGDVPRFRYNMEKVHKRGWRAKHTSDESVRETLRNLDLN